MRKFNRAEQKKESWKPVVIDRKGRFHMVCYKSLVYRLKKRFQNLFRKDNISKLVNIFIRNLELFLVYHINLERHDWEISLMAGNPLKKGQTGFDYDENGELQERKRDEKMTEHLYIYLEPKCYKILKKMHEACNTYSMAMLLRSIIYFCLNGIEQEGWALFWQRMRRWKEEYREQMKKSGEVFSYFPSHMLWKKPFPPTRFSLYNEDFTHKALLNFHPPPEEK